MLGSLWYTLWSITTLVRRHNKLNHPQLKLRG
jgi:hypothetical protein